MKTLVTKKAPSLMKGIVNMMNGAKENYDFWTAPRDGQPKSSYCLEQLADWDSKTKIKRGRKYIKVIQDHSAFAFIMVADDGKFKKGDILKAAGYNAPALNSARGNVLTGNYMIQWTGPLYLK